MPARRGARLVHVNDAVLDMASRNNEAGACQRGTQVQHITRGSDQGVSKAGGAAINLALYPDALTRTPIGADAERIRTGPTMSSRPISALRRCIWTGRLNLGRKPPHRLANSHPLSPVLLVLNECARAYGHRLLKENGFSPFVDSMPSRFCGLTQAATTVVGRGQVRVAAEATGGGLKPEAGAWHCRGHVVLDGHDLEGHIVQFNQAQATPAA